MEVRGSPSPGQDLAFVAGDWIKMRLCLGSCPEVVQIATALEIPRQHVVGCLHALWSWADEHLDDGSTTVSLSFLDDLAGVPGFASEVVSAKWLLHSSNGRLQFTHWERHMSRGAKNRSLDADRKRVQRLSGSQPDKSVTREEKRREEKNQKKKARKRATPPSRKKKPQEWTGDLPEKLEQDSTFSRLWGEWLDYRREEISKPVTQRAGQMQLRELEEMGAARGKIAIRHTIARGWVGLREPEVKEAGAIREGGLSDEDEKQIQSLDFGDSQNGQR